MRKVIAVCDNCGSSGNLTNNEPPKGWLQLKVVHSLTRFPFPQRDEFVQLDETLDFCSIHCLSVFQEESIVDVDVRSIKRRQKGK